MLLLNPLLNSAKVNILSIEDKFTLIYLYIKTTLKGNNSLSKNLLHNWDNSKQAGAELCQAQHSLSLDLDTI